MVEDGELFYVATGPTILDYGTTGQCRWTAERRNSKNPPCVKRQRWLSPRVALLEARPCRHHDPTRPWVLLCPCDTQINHPNICIR